MAGQLPLLEEPSPAPRLGPEALKERLVGAYREELLANPPVRSLAAGEGRSDIERRQEASRLAAKDIARLLKAIPAAGLEIGDRGRIATLKALLADWLRASDEDAASGGNGSESVDMDELQQRTREALHV